MSGISVVIPVLNESALLEQRLTDLQWLRDRGHELIVVDGGSGDGISTAITGLCDHFLCSAPGRSTQMNAGAALAAAEVLLFLHIDTRLPREADQAIGAALLDTTQLWGRFDVRLDSDRRLLRFIAYMINLRSRVSGVATGDQGMFVRTSVFRELGGFAPIPLMEDVELSKRLRLQARPCCLLPPVITSARRWETHGAWRTIFTMWWLRLLYFLGCSPEKLYRIYYRQT